MTSSAHLKTRRFFQFYGSTRQRPRLSPTRGTLPCSHPVATCPATCDWRLSWRQKQSKSSEHKDMHTRVCNTHTQPPSFTHTHTHTHTHKRTRTQIHTCRCKNADTHRIPRATFVMNMAKSAIVSDEADGCRAFASASGR
jgi:hypothetical protein